MKKLTKGISLFLTVMLVFVMAGCGAERNGITVITREDGSGTRSAFMELFEIEEITKQAEESNSTSVVMTTVEGNVNAIGYISMGSLRDNVKVLKIDGAEATVANIKNGTYKVSRPFNIATKGATDEVTGDFIAFILSAEGQAVVEAAGYISDGNTGAYSGKKPAGKITVSGSSSVTPVMEKLKEAYIGINPNAEIELQQSDSSTGMKDVISGTSSIGMASRELKESETEQGLVSTVIAIDGIAVIVNKENAVSNLSSAQVKSIYTEEITTWTELK